MTNEEEIITEVLDEDSDGFYFCEPEICPEEEDHTEERKQGFKEYLDKSGLMNVLNDVLVIFYESSDRSDTPLEIIKRHFSQLEGYNIEKLRSENNELREKLEALTQSIEALKPQEETTEA